MGAARPALVTLVFLFFGWVPWLHGQDQDDLQVYREIGVELSRQALDIIGAVESGTAPAERLAVAEDLARRAAQVDPSLGDPRAIQARLLLLTDRRIAVSHRTRLLSEALNRDLLLVPRRDVVAALAETLIDSGAYDRAVEILHREIAGPETPVGELFGAVVLPDTDGPQSADRSPLTPLHHLYVRAVLLRGPVWYGSDLLRRLRARYPDDMTLAAMDWERSPRTSLAFLEWIDAQERMGRSVPPGLYLTILRSGAPSVVAERAARRYVEAGGTDPLAAFLAPEGAGAALQPVFPEDRVHTALLSDKMLWEAAVEHALFEHGGQAAVDGFRGGVSGTVARALAVMSAPDAGAFDVVRDADRDGMWEERYRFEDGTLASWYYDGDEDGVVSRLVRFHEGAITVVVADRASRETISAHYTSYPLVDRVEWIADDEGVVWSPATPVRAPVGVRSPDTRGGRSDALWGVLTGRVELNGDVEQQFRRQRRSDDARRMTADRVQERRSQLLEWGMVE